MQINKIEWGSGQPLVKYTWGFMRAIHKSIIHIEVNSNVKHNIHEAFTASHTETTTNYALNKFLFSHSLFYRPVITTSVTTCYRPKNFEITSYYKIYKI